MNSRIICNLFYIASLFALTSLMSCKTDYMLYDHELKDGVYFPSDSLGFQFGLSKGEDFDYSIPVRVLGTPKDYDREFEVLILNDQTTAKKGLQYDIPTKFTIQADSVSGRIPIVLHRYSDPEMSEKAFVLMLRLVENKNFRVVVRSDCKFEFSDKDLPRPRWWSEYYFGNYSQLLMTDIFHYYWEMETTHPSLFERISAEYGRNLERAWSFPFQQAIAFVKYIITPIYYYYLEHPHPNVNVPDPATLY